MNYLPYLRLEGNDVGATELTGAIFLGVGALMGLSLLKTLSVAFENLDFLFSF